MLEAWFIWMQTQDSLQVQHKGSGSMTNLLTTTTREGLRQVFHF